MARTSTSSTRAIWRERLTAQRLAGGTSSPEAVVAHLLAVQAQELPAAMWSVGLRAGCTRAEIEAALADGRILRTHLMRGTWHFVAPADVRWMLALTAPRERQRMAGHDRKLGLTAAVVARHLKAIAKRLPLSRADIAKLTGLAGIPLANLCIHAELAQVMISGPLGYAAFDERVPSGGSGDLAARYFASHGPATRDDLAWWSGRKRSDCTQLEVDHPPAKRGLVHLLPTFDELFVGYHQKRKLENLVVKDGEPIGTWRRNPFSVDAPDSPALRGAIRRYAEFTGVLRPPA